MALSYVYDRAARLVRLTGAGQVSVADRVECVHGMIGDPDLPPVAGVLVDVSGITNSPEPGDMDHLATLVRVLRARFCSRVAIVNSSAGRLTVSIILSFMVDWGTQVQAFGDRRLATEWLTGDVP